jgi:hypothetical protein
MLYTFLNLAQRLTQLGYPESKETGFRVIRRDLTIEEQAGNVEFKTDGIYLTIDGQEYKGYMYLKYPDVARFGFPKFHITNCQTVLGQRARGQFDGRYFWHNSSTVTIEDRINGKIHQDVNLGLCSYCCSQSSVTQYSETQGFFSILDLQEKEEINREVEVDIFGYTLDWHQISKEFRKEKKYTCDKCKIQIDELIDRRFMHVHHKSGNKLNNRRSNLECLCVLCHSNVDETHVHNFERRKMQANIKAFMKKYRNQLIDTGNQYIDV